MQPSIQVNGILYCVVDKTAEGYINKIGNTNLSQCRNSSKIEIEILRYRNKIDTIQLYMTAHSLALLQLLQKEWRCLTSYLLYVYNYIDIWDGAFAVNYY